MACWQSGAINSRCPPDVARVAEDRQLGQTAAQFDGDMPLRKVTVQLFIVRTETTVNGSQTFQSCIVNAFQCAESKVLGRGLPDSLPIPECRHLSVHRLSPVRQTGWRWCAHLPKADRFLLSNIRTRAWLWQTSVATYMPVSFFTSFNQARPSTPTPSKPPGLVRGFQIPARYIFCPLAASCLAVFITCSFCLGTTGAGYDNGAFGFNAGE